MLKLYNQNNNKEIYQKKLIKLNAKKINGKVKEIKFKICQHKPTNYLKGYMMEKVF